MGFSTLIGGTKVEIVFTDSANQGALSSSPDTIPGVSIGTAGARHVIFGFFKTGSAVTSVTIGGVAATKIAELSGGSLQFWGASVPSGTSANVVIAHTGSLGSFVWGAWAVYNLKSLTELDSHTTSGSISGTTLTSKPRGGAFLIAVAACAFDQVPTLYSAPGNMDLDAQPGALGPPNYRVLLASSPTSGATHAYTVSPFSNSISDENSLSISMR